MAQTSQQITYIDPATGLTTVVNSDSDLTGFGLLASRPASGSAVGDKYLVVDAGLGIFREDLWTGSEWKQIAAVPSPGSPGQGQVMVSADGTQGAFAKPLVSHGGWLLNNEGTLMVPG